LADAARILLSDKTQWLAMRQRLLGLRAALGKGGASQAAAQEIDHLLLRTA